MPASVDRIGTVHSVPKMPKNISTGRRPIRSESAPNSGWMAAKISNVMNEICVA